MRAESRYNLFDGVLLAALTVFILTYFPWTAMTRATTLSGGDSAGQFLAGWIMRYKLLPSGHLSHWFPGNFAGYPIFEFYFPLPFLFAALLSLVIPFAIAFKWATLLGTLLMPLAVYISFRAMRVCYPAPIIAASLSLLFLFNEGNSMWGGNIPSTLAGEFAYSLSFTLSIAFFGTLYRGVAEEVWLRRNALLLAAIALSHACGLVFSALMGCFFLFNPEHFWRRLLYLLKMWGLAFLLLGFWILPLIARLNLTTPFNFVWHIEHFKEAIPWIMVPPAILGVGYSLVQLIRRRLPHQAAYLWFGIALAGFLYLLGYELHVPDIRFVPFAQVLLVLLATFLATHKIDKLKGLWLIPLVVLGLVIFWVDTRVTYIQHWTQWNYSGFEAKSSWGLLNQIMRSVQGTVKDPRVAYENSAEHNRFGTMRVFELFPYFSGRSTLEGLYLQDTLSAPFIYLIQAEISKEASHAIPNYYYPAQNLKRGIEHLKLFNVRFLLLSSASSKKAASAISGLRRHASFPPYEIYELSDLDGQYVTPVRNQPVVYTGKDWKQAAHLWFRQIDTLDIPVIFSSKRLSKDANLSRFPHVDSISNLPRVPLVEKVQVVSEMSDDQIRIHTSRVGHPLWVRVTCHPNWTIQGADRIYLVSPSMMMIVPTQRDVLMTYRRSWVDWLGCLTSLLALLGICGGGIRWVRIGHRVWPKGPTKHLRAIWVILGLGVLPAAAWNAWNRPSHLEQRANQFYNAKDYQSARRIFDSLLRENEGRAVAYRSAYFAAICSALLNDSLNALWYWEKLTHDFPDGYYAAEAYFHQWEIYLRDGRISDAKQAAHRLLRDYPDSFWAKSLRDRGGQFG